MGSGYRVFTAGEVLTASNVQNYLQNQSVMSFADSTARATSIGTANFEEGMVSYLQDSDTLEVYDGSTWGSIAPATTQGLTLINTTSFSAVASVSLPADTFTTTYNDYRVVLKLTATSTNNEVVYMKLRAAGTDNSTNYHWNRYGTFTGNSTPGGTVAAANAAGIWLQSTFSTQYFPTVGRIELFNVKLATNTRILASTAHNSGGGDAANFDGGGLHNVATAFDSASFYITSGTISGSVIVYGMAI